MFIQTEADSQLLAMVMQKVRSQRGLAVEPRSVAIAKRGDCTFVQKARTMQSGSAQFGIVVNNGKEARLCSALSLVVTLVALCMHYI